MIRQRVEEVIRMQVGLADLSLLPATSELENEIAQRRKYGHKSPTDKELLGFYHKTRIVYPGPRTD